MDNVVIKEDTFKGFEMISLGKVKYFSIRKESFQELIPKLEKVLKTWDDYSLNDRIDEVPKNALEKYVLSMWKLKGELCLSVWVFFKDDNLNWKPGNRGIHLTRGDVEIILKKYKEDTDD